MCKLLEKVVNNRLVFVLERGNVLTPFQYGIRKKRSTGDVLARVESDVLNAFAEGKHLVAILIDISKAYDTTWKCNILMKIYNYGIRGPLAHFIKNFLRDRQFKLKIGNTLSKVYALEEGVPQGSVLSVTLFAIAIDNIAS